MVAAHDITLRPIPGIVGYAAGSDGNLYTFIRRAYGRTGMPRYKTTPRVVKATVSKWHGGYPVVRMYWRGRIHRPLHRVIAEAFYGLRPEGAECSHLDGNKLNNRPDNLRWETRAQNQERRTQHGTHNRGERSGKAKLTNEAVRKIRSIYTRGARGNVALSEKLAKEFGVSPGTVRNVALGFGWKDIQ